MAHKVHFYKDTADDDHVYRPARTIETEDIEEALRLAVAAIDEAGSIHAASVRADHRLAPDLATHLCNMNILAKWLEDNPKPWCWISKITDDLAYWQDCGVKTPEDLEKYLGLETLSDIHKDLYGTRPHNGLSMESSLDEIDAAMARLRGSRAEGVDYGDMAPPAGMM